MSEDYLISSLEEGHDLMVKKSYELITIHSNKRTISFTLSMAEELFKGLNATLFGPFDRALTETALRMELEAQNRPLAAQSYTPLHSSPKLENL